MKQSRGFAWLPLLLAVVLMFGVSGTAYFYEHSQHVPKPIGVTLVPAASSTPATETKTKASTQTAQPTNDAETSIVFNRKTIAVGDTVGGLVVTNIRPISGTVLNRQDPEGNMQIVFQGAITLTGVYEGNPNLEPSYALRLSADSAAKLPYDQAWGAWHAGNVVIIDNPQVRDSSVMDGDIVTVTIQKYTDNMFPSQTYSSVTASSIKKSSN